MDSTGKARQESEPRQSNERTSFDLDGVEKRESGTEDRFGLPVKKSEAIHPLFERATHMEIVGIPIEVTLLTISRAVGKWKRELGTGDRRGRHPRS
jgi:hypothetical protein